MCVLELLKLWLSATWPWKGGILTFLPPSRPKTQSESLKTYSEARQMCPNTSSSTEVTILMTKLTTVPIFTVRIACLEAWEFFDPFWPPAAPGVPINGSKNENWEKLSLASSFCCQTLWWHQFSAFNLQFFLVNWFWPPFWPPLDPQGPKIHFRVFFSKIGRHHRFQRQNYV